MSDARPPPGAWLLRATERLGLRALERRGYQRRHHDTDWGRMHLLDRRCEGDGPPLLLFHGLSSAAIDFAPLMLRLERHTRRLIVPDLPGHGWSDPPTEPELLGSMLQLLEPIVDEPVVVIGNSLGGLVGAQWALERPELVEGLVLMSPGGAPSEQAVLDELMRGFSFEGQRDAAAFMDRVLAVRQSAVSRQLHAWGVRQRMVRPGALMVLQHAAPDRMLTPEHLGALPGRILLLWGRRDRVLPAGDLAFWREHLPDHALIEQPEHFGHSPFLDDPADLTARIVRFLDGE